MRRLFISRCSVGGGKSTVSSLRVGLSCWSVVAVKDKR